MTGDRKGVQREREGRKRERRAVLAGADDVLVSGDEGMSSVANR